MIDNKVFYIKHYYKKVIILYDYTNNENIQWVYR